VQALIQKLLNKFSSVNARGTRLISCPWWSLALLYSICFAALPHYLIALVTSVARAGK
jgi:hypothetical protein